MGENANRALPPMPDSLLVIAGWGKYPELLIEGARKAGVGRICVLGFRGSVGGAARRMADECRVIPLGSLALFLETVRRFKCSASVMAGQIHPFSFFTAKFDDAVKAELRKLPFRNAHTMFGRISEMLAENGAPPLPASCFMGHCMPQGDGVFCGDSLPRGVQADVDLGFDVALKICDLDIGQTVVVKDGVILAVEGFDGTNATIKRGGRIARSGASVVKVAKNGHDARFDIPVVGARTIKMMRKAKMRALALQAGRAIVLDEAEVGRLAQKAGITILVRESNLPHFPFYGE